MAEFDRANPLFECDNVPFEVFTYSGTQGCSETPHKSASAPDKTTGTFTVRILQGHRPPKNGSGDKERVIRFEMSDECNLIGNSLQDRSRIFNPVGVPPHSTPSRRSFQYSIPNMPNTHAPIMMTDAGRGHTTMQIPGHLLRNSSDGSDLYSKTVPHLPIELFELEVGESDFHDLRRDQALLVEFHDFANSLISLLHVCDRGDLNNSQPPERNDSFENTQFIKPLSDSTNGPLKWGIENCAWNNPSQSHQVLNQWQSTHGVRIPSPYGKNSVTMPVSTYTCRLEVNSPMPHESTAWRNTPKSVSTHSRFSIVESNQFRELVHLALNLSTGTDKSVRLYLSLRLNQIMMQNRNIQLFYAEEKRRCDTAETELLGLRKSMKELTQATENEKYQIHHQAEERLQSENCSRLVEVNELKTAKDAEIKALNQRHEKNRAILESKLCVLEEVNAKINSKQAATEGEKDLLATKLSFQESTNHTMANELSSLRSKLQLISEEKTAVEKSLHQLQLQLTSLEYSNNTNEKTLFQTEAQRISAEKISADAQRILSKQHSQMAELQKRLEEAENETLKYKDLTSRYHANRLEMKKRMKDKAETIREQEDIFVAKEKELTDLKCRVQGLVDELMCTKSEKEVLACKLNDAKHQMQDDKKKLENNQQVCYIIYVCNSRCRNSVFIIVGVSLSNIRLLHGLTNRCQVAEGCGMGRKQPALLPTPRDHFHCLLLQFAKYRLFLATCQTRVLHHTSAHMSHLTSRHLLERRSCFIRSQLLTLE